MNEKIMKSVAALAVAAILFAGCSEGTGLQDVVPRIGLCQVHYDSGSPQADAFEPVPADETIAVDFGPTDISMPKRLYLFLQNTGTGDLRLNSIEKAAGFGEQFFVRCRDAGGFTTGACPGDGEQGPPVAPGDNLVLELEFAPLAVGDDSAGFVVETDAIDHPELTVEMSGKGVERRLLVCIADCTGGEEDPGCARAEQLCDAELGAGENLAVDFGTITPWEEVTRLVSLENIGEQELLIESLRLSSGDVSQFSWLSEDRRLPGSLAAGEKETIEVTYRPGSGGEHSAVLHIGSDGGQADVDLTGRFAAPCVCADPLAVDFKTLAVGESAAEEITLTNCGLADLTLDDVRLDDEASADFSLSDLPAFAHVLAPEESLVVKAVYQPNGDGSDAANVEIYSDDITSDPDSGLTGSIMLWGRGVVRQCRMQATPYSLLFGGVETGEACELELLVSNQGTDSCTFDGAAITTNSADDEFSLIEAPAAGTEFGPGDILVLRVAYAPQDLGADEGELQIDGTDVSGQPLVVPLSGAGIAEATCDLCVQPVLLQFGAVEPHGARWMEIHLENLGSAACQVTGLELIESLTYPSDFTITDGPGSDFELARRGKPGDHAVIEVSFTPDEEGEHAGVVWFHTDDDPGFRIGYGVCVRPGFPPQAPEEGDACISLSGMAVESDLEVVPGELDFGVVTVGCNSADLHVTVYNMGYFTISVENIVLDPADDGQFEIVAAPATAFDLGWSESFGIDLRYHPQQAGRHGATLVIETDDFDIPRFTVPLRGEGTHITTQTDIFTQPVEDAVDVLFVVDNSESMGEEQTALAENFDHFIDWAQTQNADFQLGVITTMADGEEYMQGDPPRDIVAGELVAAPGRPAVLNRDTPELAAAFAENIHVGTSPTASTERGLAAAKRALTPPELNEANAGFLREEAKLIIVAVSDENDQSDGSVDYFMDFFASLKGVRNTERMDISAIVGDMPDGCQGPGGEADPCGRYIEIAGLSGGVQESICTDDWGAALENIGLDAFAGMRDFPLSRPASPDTIEVLVDDEPVEQAACPGCAGGWWYYLDGNSVYFGDGTVPEKGATIEISYDTVCAGG